MDDKELEQLCDEKLAAGWTAEEIEALRLEMGRRKEGIKMAICNLCAWALIPCEKCGTPKCQNPKCENSSCNCGEE